MSERSPKRDDTASNQGPNRAKRLYDWSCGIGYLALCGGMASWMSHQPSALTDGLIVTGYGAVFVAGIADHKSKQGRQALVATEPLTEAELASIEAEAPPVERIPLSEGIVEDDGGRLEPRREKPFTLPGGKLEIKDGYYIMDGEPYFIGGYAGDN